MRVFKLYDEKLEVIKDSKGEKHRLLVIQFDDSSQYKKFRDHFSLKIKDEVIKCHKIGDYRVLKKFLKGFQESKERQDELSYASSDSEEEDDERYIQKFQASGQNYFQVYHKLFGIKAQSKRNLYLEDTKTEKNELLDDILDNWQKNIILSPGSNDGSKAEDSSSKNLSLEFDFVQRSRNTAGRSATDLDQMHSNRELGLRNGEKLKLVKKPSNHSSSYFQDHFKHQASNQPNLDLMKESYQNYLPGDKKEQQPIITSPKPNVAKKAPANSRGAKIQTLAVDTRLLRRVKPRNFTESEIMGMSDQSIRKLLEYQKSIFELKQRLIEEKYEKVKEKIAQKIKLKEEQEKKEAEKKEAEKKKKRVIKKPNNKKRRKPRSKKNKEFSEYVRVRR